MLHLTYRALKVMVISVIGVTLIGFGIVLLVTPGPGWVLILAGLAVLAVEFVWARRLLKRLRTTLQGVADNVSAAGGGENGFKARARKKWNGLKSSVAAIWARVSGRTRSPRY